MAQASEISRLYKIPFRKIKIVLQNDSLSPLAQLSEGEIEIINNYLFEQKQKEEERRNTALEKLSKRKRGRRKRGKSEPNPLNPNEYKYKSIELINTPMGGKIK